MAHFGSFRVDEGISDDRSLYIDIDDVTVVIRRARPGRDENVTVMMFPLCLVDQPLAELRVSRSTINAAYAFDTHIPEQPRS